MPSNLTGLDHSRNETVMKWIELSVTTPPEFVEPLAQLFRRHGHGGVVIENVVCYNPDEGEKLPDGDVKVLTYIPRKEFTCERRSWIDLGVRLVAHVASISPLVEREIDQVDWENAWKEHFQPLRIGDKVVIVPSWSEYSPKTGDLVTCLDPGMAFGTGHHPTTKMCIELLEEHVCPGFDILDMGCGSGILSIVAAKLGASRVIGLEIDDVAANVAASNVKSNEVCAVEVIHGTLPHPAVVNRTFDITIANISSREIVKLAPHLMSSMKPEGVLIASGILEENADNVVEAMSARGSSVVGTFTEEDWVTLVVKGPSSS